MELRGEFSFFKMKDQTEALSHSGAYGIPFSEQVDKFHISFMIGDDQPRFQKPEVIRKAGMNCGYQFHATRFVGNSTASELEIENRGIAPFYYDAFPAVAGVRSEVSLTGLLPGESWRSRIAKASKTPVVSIECDRWVPGQKIEFAADLK
jgi:hypothetical protein